MSGPGPPPKWVVTHKAHVPVRSDDEREFHGAGLSPAVIANASLAWQIGRALAEHTSGKLYEIFAVVPLGEGQGFAE